MDLCFQASALMAIQEAMETWVVRLMEDIQAKHVTIISRDLLLVWKLGANNGVNVWLDPSCSAL